MKNRLGKIEEKRYGGVASTPPPLVRPRVNNTHVSCSRESVGKKTINNLVAKKALGASWAVNSRKTPVRGQNYFIDQHYIIQKDRVF